MARIHDLPVWLVGFSTVFVFVGGSFLGLAVSRRWSRSRGLHALVDNSVIGWIFSAILGIYAIAIGLIAVASWENASEASSVASHEAAEIAALYRDLGGYPQPIQGNLEDILARYTRGIIVQDWPQQRLGEEPRGGMPILHEFTRLLYSFDPKTQAQASAHAEALQAFNRMIEFRRMRLEAVSYAVPSTLWSVVLLGAFVSIMASYVFNMESFWVHATMTGLLAAMIGLLVFFILITDLPYHGQNGIGPEAYDLVLHDVIEARVAR